MLYSLSNALTHHHSFQAIAAHTKMFNFIRVTSYGCHGISNNQQFAQQLVQDNNKEKHQSSTLLVLCEGNHWWQVDSPHKGQQKECILMLWHHHNKISWYSIFIRMILTSLMGWHPLFCIPNSYTQTDTGDIDGSSLNNLHTFSADSLHSHNDTQAINVTTSLFHNLWNPLFSIKSTGSTQLLLSPLYSHEWWQRSDAGIWQTITLTAAISSTCMVPSTISR